MPYKRRGIRPGYALYLLCDLGKSLYLSEPLQDGYYISWHVSTHSVGKCDKMAALAMVIYSGLPWARRCKRRPACAASWSPHDASRSHLCRASAGWQHPGLDLALMAESVPTAAPAAIRLVTSRPQSGVVGCLGHVPTGPCAVPAQASLLLTRHRSGKAPSSTTCPHKGHSPGWS